MSFARIEFNALMAESLNLQAEFDSCANRLEGVVRSLEVDDERFDADFSNQDEAWQGYKERLISVGNQQFGPLASLHLRLIHEFNSKMQQLRIWKEAQSDVPQLEIVRVAYLWNIDTDDVQGKKRSFAGEIEECEGWIKSLETAWKGVESRYREVLEEAERQYQKYWTSTSQLGPVANFAFLASYLLPKNLWNDPQYKDHKWLLLNANPEGKIPEGRCLKVHPGDSLSQKMDAPAHAQTDEEYLSHLHRWRHVDTLPFHFETDPPQITVKPDGGIDQAIDDLKLTHEFQAQLSQRKLLFYPRLGDELTTYPDDIEEGKDVYAAIKDLHFQLAPTKPQEGQQALSIFYSPFDRVLDGVVEAFRRPQADPSEPALTDKVYSAGVEKDKSIWCSVESQMLFTNSAPLQVKAIWDPATMLMTLRIRSTEDVREEALQEQADHVEPNELVDEVAESTALLTKDQELVDKWEELGRQLGDLQIELQELVQNLKERVRATQDATLVLGASVLNEIYTYVTETYAPLHIRIKELENKKNELRAEIKERILLDNRVLSEGTLHYFATQQLGAIKGGDEVASSIQKMRASIEHEKEKLRQLDHCFQNTTKIFQEKKKELDQVWARVKKELKNMADLGNKWRRKAEGDSRWGVWGSSSNSFEKFMIFGEVREAIQEIDRRNISLGDLRKRLERTPAVHTERQALNTWIDTLDLHACIRDNAFIAENLEAVDLFEPGLYPENLQRGFATGSEKECELTVDWMKENLSDPDLQRHLLDAMKAHFFNLSEQEEDLQRRTQYETDFIPKIIQVMNQKVEEKTLDLVRPCMDLYFEQMTQPSLAELYALCKRHNFSASIFVPKDGELELHLTLNSHAEPGRVMQFTHFCRAEAPCTPLFQKYFED